MKDYQILIDHAWSLNPDLFEMFRQNFQEELDKRRPFIKEFHNKLSCDAVSRLWIWKDEGVGWLRPLNVMRALLPVRISQRGCELGPAPGRQNNAQQFWDDGEYRVDFRHRIPIDTIHPTLSGLELAEDMVNQINLIRGLNKSLPRTEALLIPMLFGYRP